MRLILILIIFATTYGITNKEYTKKYAEGFSIPLEFIHSFSFAESSHRKDIVSSKGAIGRFQIRPVLLKHYCKIAGFDFSKIKDVKNFLKNDKNNTYIFCYMIAFWKRKGYSLSDITQIWLFGETGFLKGRYSYSFLSKIIKDKV